MLIAGVGRLLASAKARERAPSGSSKRCMHGASFRELITTTAAQSEDEPSPRKMRHGE
jgi:hypothetical protein